MDEAILDCWITITNLMKSGNEQLFPTRRVTRDLIRSGRYVSLLNDFGPKLRSWRDNFERIQSESETPSRLRPPLTTGRLCQCRTTSVMC